MEDLVSYFSVQSHSVFFPLKYLYPECFLLIADSEKLHPLVCFKDNCHKSANCAEKLAKRIHFLFQHVVPDAEVIYAYYKYRDRPMSVRAGVFNKDMTEPKLLTLNRAAFRKFMKEGIAYQWQPPMDYWLLGGSNKLIPVESLLVKV